MLSVNLGLDFLGSEDFLNHAFLVDKVCGTEDVNGPATASHLLQLLRDGVGQRGMMSVSIREWPYHW